MTRVKTVLITGGTSGIGEAMVRLFSSQGYRVWFTYRSDRQGADRIIRDLDQKQNSHSGQKSGNGSSGASGNRPVSANTETNPPYGNVPASDLITPVAFQFDLSITGSHRKLANRLPGTPDILINNAGLGTATVRQLSDDADEQDRLLIDVNATGTLLLTRVILDGMKKRTSGRIIFISSVGGGINVYPGFSLADGMSKAAVTFLGRQLAAETVHSAIRVFTICPGATDTPMFASSTLDPLTDEERTSLISDLPGGRLIEPGEIAGLALWLCGDTADILHGAVLDASLGLGVNPGVLQKKLPS